MKKLKNLIRVSFPSLFAVMSSVRFFIACKKRLGDTQNLVSNTLFNNENITVLSGPFEGLKYYNKTIWGTITSKWIGCYELEIRSVIEEIIDSKYDLIVDIGAAEGYYAVGLAYRLSESKIITYDTDPIARFRQRQLAKLNNITNLEIKKYCSHSELEALTAINSVIICDTEGYEIQLLNPKLAPKLKIINILVECHKFDNFSVRDVVMELKSRFGDTHYIEEFESKTRDIELYRSTIQKFDRLSDRQAEIALDEGRYPGQIWLWMKVKD
ncbi:hypothetical protein JIN85_08650 [Luteolibacter pohnpeiensis]|uniref:Methyltransferase FkbM domain-containing protein n=1 Tax=Luteolibacter pohnpeiensis TaxID=454153 RepID=A0A934S575_9BACT|nr:hypothetical protein [Luteolibacter pohnpeiensis]MBK1882482.1 hypothetical protein [Luteolibacter pohnpeiensis]